MTNYYFGYGSNLHNEDYLKGWKLRNKTAQPLRVYEKGRNVWLPDYRPDYTYESKSRKCGVLDIMECPGAVTPGTLFKVDEVDMEKLNAKEGFHGEGMENIYDRITVSVLTSTGERIEAFTYKVSQNKRSESFVEPSDYYKGIIHEGFQEKGFDEGTIQMMDLVASGETLFPSVDFFVYGTLRTGGNLARALDGLNRKPASFPGRLYKLGGYPGFYPDKDGGPIVGEKVEVPLARVGEETSSIVAELDRVEGFYGYRAEDWKRSLFHRVWLPTEVYGPNAGCWVYVYSKPEPDLSPDSLIASGDWFRR